MISSSHNNLPVMSSNNANEFLFAVLMCTACVLPCYIICQCGRTPLHFAARAASVECVKELMQHADIAAALIMRDIVSNNKLCIYDDIIKLNSPIQI